MFALTDSVKIIVANHLHIKRRTIEEVRIITALPYSLKTVEIVENAIKEKGIGSVKDIDHKQLENSSDNLLVCCCIIKDSGTYLALVLDPEELYEAAQVVKIRIL